MNTELNITALTPGRWQDFVSLFGSHGAYGGCWCMYWRCTRREFEANQGEGNRKRFKAIVDSGEPTGLLGYASGEPAAWCGVAPRDSLPSLNRSPVLKPLDEQPVWSLTCLYVAGKHRGNGYSLQMIEAAKRHVSDQNGTILEAYPTLPGKDRKMPPVSVYMGVPGWFERAGFELCAQPSRAKQIWRWQEGWIQAT